MTADQCRARIKSENISSRGRLSADRMGRMDVGLSREVFRLVLEWGRACRAKREMRDGHNRDSHGGRILQEVAGKCGEVALETAFPSFGLERHYPGGWHSDFKLYEVNEVDFSPDMAPGVSVKVSLEDRHRWSWLAANGDRLVPDGVLARFGRPHGGWRFPKTPLSGRDIIVLMQCVNLPGFSAGREPWLQFTILGFVFAKDVARKFAPSKSLRHKMALYYMGESWVDTVIPGHEQMVSAEPVRPDVRPILELGPLLDGRP